MDVFERMPARTPNDDAFSILFPFENRARADTELPANLSGNGDLTLSCDLGLR
jgi:hypothetical protein